MSISKFKKYLVTIIGVVIVLVIVVGMADKYIGLTYTLGMNILHSKTIYSEKEEIKLSIPFWWNGDTPLRWQNKEGKVFDLVLGRSSINGLKHHRSVYGNVQFIHKHYSKETLQQEKESKKFSAGYPYIGDEDIRIKQIEAYGIFYQLPIFDEYGPPDNDDNHNLIREIITIPDHDLLITFVGFQKDRPYLNELLDGLEFLK